MLGRSGESLVGHVLTGVQPEVDVFEVSRFDLQRCLQHVGPPKPDVQRSLALFPQPVGALAWTRLEATQPLRVEMGKCLSLFQTLERWSNGALS